jgi:predicted Mrr-cat superfamily restriction endonuclease
VNRNLTNVSLLNGTKIGNAKGMTREKLRNKFNHPGESTQAFKQFANFCFDVRKGDRVIASSSGTGIYALGTVIGGYEFNEEL